MADTPRADQRTISERLRHRTTLLGPGAEPCYSDKDRADFIEAADEIERLRVLASNVTRSVSLGFIGDKRLVDAAALLKLWQATKGPMCETCGLEIVPGTVHMPGYGAHCIPEVVAS
jgi:hypothetical protein